jgi:hypothetical protein
LCRPFSGTPTGTVTFKEGSAVLGTGTLNFSRQATFTTTALSAGNHNIAAEYNGDLNFNGSASVPLAQEVGKADATTTLTSSTNPSEIGSSIVFTATVNIAAGIPSGTVTYKNGGVPIGSATLDGSGQAAFFTTELTIGSYDITAEYSGDSNYNASSSSTLTQIVSKATTSAAVTASPSPSAYGQPVSFTALVAAANGIPTGTVIFKNGSTTLDTVALNGEGQASFSKSDLPIGTHTITVEYSGDENYKASTGSVIQKVNKGETSVTLISSPNPSGYYQSAAFIATVSALLGTPTGTVTFKDGDTVLGTSNLDGNCQAVFLHSTLTGGSRICFVHRMF